MKKKLAAVLAALIAISAFTACNSTGDTDKPAETTTTTTSAKVAPLEVPEDTNTVIASVSTENNPEFFDITFSQFLKEYKFHLLTGGIDETDAANAESCEEIRRNILDFLMLERVLLRAAEDAGKGVSSLTKNELDEIDKSVKADYDSWCERFEEDAKKALGEKYTNEELYNKEYELFVDYLAQVGMEPEIFAEWKKNELVCKKILVTDKEVEDYYDELVKKAEDMYKSDIDTFQESYSSFWLPEGARALECIYIPLDNSIITEILAYRKDGDNEKADSLLEESLGGIRELADSVLAALDGGTSWEDVQATYGQDESANELTIDAYEKSPLFSEEDLAKVMAIPEIGGYTDLISTDGGYYIFCYVKDSVVDKQLILNSIKNVLFQQAQYDASNETLKALKEKYSYTVNYDLIDVTDPATTTAPEATTAQDVTTA